MASKQELQVQEKRALENREEATTPARIFLATTDICETEDSLTVVMEMPGVNKDNVDISVEDGTLKVYGRIDFANYEGMQPIYTEYNVGHYARSFRLSNPQQCKVAPSRTRKLRMPGFPLQE